MEPPGRLIGAGRAADVFALGDARVLRRYREPHDVELEARIMRWVAEQGVVRVPEVHGADGDDLVMAHVPGPTMLEDLDRHPWRLVSHGRLLAALQRQLNSLSAPDWFPTRPGAPRGGSVVHLDLHPLNVLLSPDGPTIIDWTNGGRSEPGFDAAMTYVLIAGFEARGLKERVGRRILVESFVAARGRRLARSHLSTAIESRVADPHATDAERETLTRLAR